MSKLGVCVSTLSASQLNYHLINALNRVAAGNTDVIAFYENISKPCVPVSFPLMSIYDGYNYDGVMVATNFNTAAKLIKFPCSRSKYFYVHDLEWIRHDRRHYGMLASVYCNPELRLLTRGAEYARILRSCWNREVHVIEEMNLDTLCELQ
jgi:hypothetical protein